MKEHILKYIELSPDRGYNDLVKIFGLSIEELLKLLDINNYNIEYYNIEYYYIQIYDNNGNEIYFEDSDGGWCKWEYDANGKLIYKEDSEGYKYNY